MEKSHIKALLKYRLKLARNLDISEVLQYLIQEEIVNDRLVEKIFTNHSTKFGRNVAFLNILPTRGPKAYSEFILSLKETQQTFLADLLTTAEVDQIPDQILRKLPCTCYHSVSVGTSLYNKAKSSNQENESNVSVDVRDGSSLFVEKTNMEFYKSNFQKSYKMISSPRGLALLISNTSFTDNTLQYRVGGNIDRDNLTSVLKHLGYKVLLIENRTSAQIYEALNDFVSRTEHETSDSCLLAMLSHGKKGVIFGTDGCPVEIERVFSMFDNASCPQLRNKPKIFFVQSCRGDASDIGIDVSDGRMRPCEVDRSTECRSRLPIRSDMIIGYATLQGQTAMRNTSHGSWYIEALVKVLAKYSKYKDLSEMLVIVNSIIKGRESSGEPESEKCKVMSEYHSNLCKRLFFFPGINQKSSKPHK